METSNTPNPKLVYIVTAAITAKSFLKGQSKHLSETGMDLTIVATPGPELDHVRENEQVQVKSIAMEREIQILRDLLALFKLVRFLFKLQPDIVNASTPKAGLLGMLAARLTRVPVRIYQLRGLRLETTHGLKRFILITMERIAAHSAHWIVCNSFSLKQAYVDLNLAPESKLLVLGDGSSNGVDGKHFSNLNKNSEQVKEIREKLGLTDQNKVIGFVGRLTRDKGIVELIREFDRILTICPETRLLLIGALERGDPLPSDVVNRLNSDPDILLTGFVDDPTVYYQLMDVLAFPSHREGFPNAPIEAAASGIPTVGYIATGTIDAVVDNETGLLVPKGDVTALSQGLLKLLNEPELTHRMGLAARSRAIKEFGSHIVWNNWANFYKACLNNDLSSILETSV